MNKQQKVKLHVIHIYIYIYTDLYIHILESNLEVFT